MFNESDATPLLQDAPKSLRLFNYIIDLFSSSLFTSVVLHLLDLTRLAVTIHSINVYALMFIFLMSYYSIMEGLTGRTVGKFITKTRVVTITGERANFDTVLGRSLCRLIPFEPISFLLFDRGWHDKFTKTRVVMQG